MDLKAPIAIWRIAWIKYLKDTVPARSLIFWASCIMAGMVDTHLHIVKLFCPPSPRELSASENSCSIYLCE
jgi:hypothetical protein